LQNLRFCNTGNPLPVVALQPLLAALQTTVLFAIEDSIQYEDGHGMRNKKERKKR